MSGRVWRFLLSIVSLGLLLLSQPRGTLAQAASTVTLTPPDTSSFPHLTAYLDVHDPSGGFVHGLSMPDVSIVEDGTQLPVNSLTESEPGVQFVLAITPGPSFAIRDATGISRYEYLLQGLLAGTWAAKTAGGDDFSLLALRGPQLIHSSSPAALRSSLESYQPDGTDVAPSLEVLASALQVASDPTPHPGMKRAILFITPPQESDISLGLQSIIANANQQDIHIFVWLVAPQESFSLPAAEQLRNLADQTGATFFEFSHDEPVPDLETLLDPLRYVYQLGYDSHVAAAGAHQVVAQVTINSELFTSQPQTFEIDLQPPALVILDLPTAIVRKLSSQPTPGASNTLNELWPDEERLNVQVTFPDGYQRPLARTSLFIDGAVVAENTNPPYDRFIWDLRSYTQDGTHTIKVEAADDLGLVGQSAEFTVKITVPSNAQEVVAVVSQKRLVVIGVTVLISASILVLVLIVGGRIHPRPYPGQVTVSTKLNEKINSLGYRERLRRLRDPVTQPVKIGAALPQKARLGAKGWRGLFPWVRHKEVPTPALAYLVPLVGSDEPTLSSPYKISTDIVTLGSDSQKSTILIVDPSIEGLHARIQHEGQSFLIIDSGSVAGTWVNYVQVPSDGVKLENADIIHLGKVGFRFNLSEPGAQPKVIVTPLEPDR